MAEIFINERRWRTDKGPLSRKLEAEFNKTIQGGTDSAKLNYTSIAFGIQTASANFKSISFNHTFSDTNEIVPWAIALVTSTIIGVASLSTTFVQYTTSAAAAVFYAGVFGR